MRENTPVTRGRGFFDVKRQEMMAAAQSAKKTEQQHHDAPNNNGQQSSEKMPAVCLRAMQGMQKADLVPGAPVQGCLVVSLSSDS